MGAHRLLMLLLFLTAWGVTGCGSMSVTINSVPKKSKIFVRPVGGGEMTEVGETPMVLSKTQLISSDSHQGPVFVEVRKEGYAAQRVLITDISAVDINLNFALESQLESGQVGKLKDIDDIRKLNLTIDRLFEVKKFVSLESYGEALKHLRVIEANWPYLSATYELKGGILFLQKKYRDALAAYSLSLKYNPTSVPTAHMRDTIQKKLGLTDEEIGNVVTEERLPASIDEVPETKKKKKKKRRKKRRKRKKRRAAR